MKYLKNIVLLVVAAFILFSLSGFASAWCYDGYGDSCQVSYIYKPSQSYKNPSFSSSFSSNAHYSESPGYIKLPDENYRQKYSAKSNSNNFDSSSSGYDYRGPIYERKIVYTEDFSKKRYDKSSLFSSKSKDTLKYSVSNVVTEKYIGASESSYSNSQNRRSSSEDIAQEVVMDYNGGFAFGKQRTFDSNEYRKDSYTEPYYYRPYYNSQNNYYNWKY